MLYSNFWNPTIDLLLQTFDDPLIIQIDDKIDDTETTFWHCWTIFRGEATKGKCYADKPETIEHLKSIDEHTRKTAQKLAWSNKVLLGMNEIIFNF